MSFGNFPAQVDGGYYGQLKCKCGSDYLHQDNVTIFKRAEDADITTVIAQQSSPLRTHATRAPADTVC
jgi:hypothetical protein